MRRVLSATAASALFTDADAPTPLANLFYHEPVAVLAMVRTAGARSDGALAHRPPRIRVWRLILAIPKNDARDRRSARHTAGLQPSELGEARVPRC